MLAYLQVVVTATQLACLVGYYRYVASYHLGVLLVTAAVYLAVFAIVRVGTATVWKIGSGYDGSLSRIARYIFIAATVFVLALGIFAPRGQVVAQYLALLLVFFAALKGEFTPREEDDEAGSK